MNDCPPLRNLVEEILEWCLESNFPFGFSISWTPTQLDTISQYLSVVNVNPEFSLRMYRKLCLNEAWQQRFEQQIQEKAGRLVVSFMQDLGELFKVPKLHQLSHEYSTLNKYELVVGFIRFLFQLLLHPNPLLFERYGARPTENRVMKELRLLVKILGDTPFQATESEQVQSILEEFEQVANRAGTLVHCLIIFPQPGDKTRNDALGILLKHFQLLNDKIQKFLDFLPRVVGSTPVSNDGIDTQTFIVNSLLNDLEDLTNWDPPVEVKGLIRKIHEGLVLCHSLLRAPQCVGIELKKEHVVQFIAGAYVAESLIHSFLVGDVPLWYFKIRFTHLISNIQLHATGLQKMIPDYDIGAPKLADDLSAQPALQAKKDLIAIADEIIVGFDQQKEVILDQLVQGTTKLQHILIFGMPGIGKTTLAKNIFCHPWIRHHFDKSSWCIVSQMYLRKTLLIDILTCISSDLNEDSIMDMDEECLELEIYQTLKGRRYLIVMDDIWNSEVLDDLSFLPDDGNGSRILFTGRDKCVASSGSTTHKLPFLSNDQCWELLEKKVFHNTDCPPELYKIGKKIAANCYGLPLAVVVIAGILSTMNKQESAWENVRQSLDCYLLADQSNSMMKILELSYKHLPQHLKPCFLYFGEFKENEQIHVKKLIQLWVAEGLVRNEEKKNAVCVADEYLKELIDKSLIMVVKK